MKEPRADVGENEWRTLSSLPTADLIDISNGLWGTVPDPEEDWEDAGIAKAIAGALARERGRL